LFFKIGNKITPTTILFKAIGFTDYQVGVESGNNVIKGIKNVLGLKRKNIAILENKVYPELSSVICTYSGKEEEEVTIIAKDTDDNKREFSPEEIAGLMLAELRTSIIEYLKRKPLKDRQGLVLYASDPINLQQLSLSCLLPIIQHIYLEPHRIKQF
jgi:hypothetical protein